METKTNFNFTSAVRGIVGKFISRGLPVLHFHEPLDERDLFIIQFALMPYTNKEWLGMVHDEFRKSDPWKLIEFEVIDCETDDWCETYDEKAMVRFVVYASKCAGGVANQYEHIIESLNAIIDIIDKDPSGIADRFRQSIDAADSLEKKIIDEYQRYINAFNLLSEEGMESKIDEICPKTLIKERIFFLKYVLSLKELEALLSADDALDMIYKHLSDDYDDYDGDDPYVLAIENAAEACMDSDETCTEDLTMGAAVLELQKLGFPVVNFTDTENNEERNTIRPSIKFGKLPRVFEDSLKKAWLSIPSEDSLSIQHINWWSLDTNGKISYSDRSAVNTYIVYAPKYDLDDDSYKEFLHDVSRMIRHIKGQGLEAEFKKVNDMVDQLKAKVHKENLSIYTLTLTSREMYQRQLIEDAVIELIYSLSNEELEKMLSLENIIESVAPFVSIERKGVEIISDAIVDNIIRKKGGNNDE